MGKQQLYSLKPFRPSFLLTEAPTEAPADHHVNEEFEVNSFETLQFVAEKYNIPANKIAADLKVPERMTGEKLGRLKKQFSFTMVHSFWLSKLQVF